MLAIITGATGQDGSYLCEFLLERGYTVKCLCRVGRERGLLPSSDRLEIYEGDVLDQPILHRMIRDSEDHERVEIYNLAAQSHVGVSFNCPSHTFETNTNGILNILECVRQSGTPWKYRIYQASSSEMFGKVRESPQNEDTPFHPRSVYGVSKVAAHWLVKNYRETYGIYACSGILFNHESPRRGADFVTKKITEHVKRGAPLVLGNLNAVRDWGHAKDYVEAMWLMLQQDTADDYVVATGKTHSVREFVEMCYEEVGEVVCWEGEGVNEVGKVDGEIMVRVSPKFFRPCEVDAVVGDARKMRGIGWTPRYTIQDLIREMMMS